MSISVPSLPPLAKFAGVTARGLLQVSHDLADLDSGGRWAVVLGYEGEAHLLRFESWTHDDLQPHEMGSYEPPREDWRDSLPQTSYEAGVRDIRARISRGEVYQVNLCRVLSASVGEQSDPVALWRGLDAGNPSPFSAVVRVPGLGVVSASPELFVRREGATVTCGPIKGTSPDKDGFTEKDEAENLMIVDLVRNDLGRICEPGTVSVPHLMRVEQHPGLYHLVSDVSGELQPGTTWSQILAALFPPGSVTGAPKQAAIGVIKELEPEPRGPYCGALGWIDADSGTAELAVAIRSFWFKGGVLRFGTGAGITWGSHPAAEWEETELKAQRLMALASHVVRTR